MATKSFGRVEVKDAAKGEVTAVFATLNVVDHDGDVTVKGAFTDGEPVRISAYNHKSWQGELPVGRGTIRVVGDEAIFEGQFFMDTTHGRDTFTTVKELGDLGEWSYGYEPLEYSFGEVDGRQVRFLNRVKVYEVCPVLLGAGINSRTLAAKSGLKLAEHVASVVADVDTLVERAAEVMALRSEKGKTISEVSADQLGRLTTSLKRLEELLVAPANDTPADDQLRASALREAARFVALNTQGA